MNQTIDHVLQQLAATFTVREIMVETDKLVRASTPSEAQHLLAQHPEFDVIPLPATGQVTEYLCRNDEKPREVTSSHLISDGTSLLDIPRLMERQVFYFILSSNTIAGFVHFSDLNKSLVKLPFFVLFEAIERRLWSLIHERLNEEDLRMVLGAPRLKGLNQRKMNAREEDVDVGWSGLLSFREILNLARRIAKTKKMNAIRRRKTGDKASEDSMRSVRSPQISTRAVM
jgi:hypothetical protein